MSKKQTKHLVELMLKAGHTNKEIAEELSISMSHVQKLKRDLGMTVKQRDPREDAAEIIKLHEQGYTRAEIAEQVGWAIHTVGDILRENGYGVYTSKESLEPAPAPQRKQRKSYHVNLGGRNWVDETESFLELEGDSIWNM